MLQLMLVLEHTRVIDEYWNLNTAVEAPLMVSDPAAATVTTPVFIFEM
jgi:hypothetical protein